MTDNIQGHTKVALAGAGPDATMIGTLRFAKMIAELERLRAEVARVTADRDAGALDYCALMERYDAATTRAEAKGAPVEKGKLNV